MPFEKTPVRALPKNYRPPNSVPRKVHDKEDWGSIAAEYRMDALKLMEFNFNTRDPGEVNYYLRANVGCNKPTVDGKNWMFSDSANPGTIYVPPTPPLPPNFNTQSAMVKFDVPHFKGLLGSSCWHDSARMIYQFKRKADMNPLPAKFATAATQGIDPPDFIDLAKSVGMRSVPAPSVTYTTQSLADMLTRYGPLWAAGTWNGGNHIIVITGVDSTGKVYVNDPAFPVPQERTIGWFNQKLYRNADVENSLMYLP